MTNEQQLIYDKLKASFEQIDKIVEFINDEEAVRKAYKSFQEHVKDYKVIDLNK